MPPIERRGHYTPPVSTLDHRVLRRCNPAGQATFHSLLGTSVHRVPWRLVTKAQKSVHHVLEVGSAGVRSLAASACAVPGDEGSRDADLVGGNR